MLTGVFMDPKNTWVTKEYLNLNKIDEQASDALIRCAEELHHNTALCKECVMQKTCDIKKEEM